ncbi:alpha/beta hydrolase [Nonomuraea sp. NPDC050691]|uniref:alpha/beta fold hydrolase n=1 Tax=Nonomuraea sp. NPDC050691 TaxID=3155661 RepID=UPI0033DF0AE5
MSRRPEAASAAAAPHAGGRRTRLSYQVSGRGPVLVLHPGIYQLGSFWTGAGYAGALRETHTIVQLDPLAHGGSQAPRDPGAYGLARRAEDVVAVLDDMGVETAAFWGYSLGALIGCGLARHAPGRLSALVLGGWDPVGGIETLYTHLVRHAGFPPGTDWARWLLEVCRADPEQAKVIDGGDPEAFRLCHQALEGNAGLDADLGVAGVPLLLYCGSADVYHDSMRQTAERAGAPFVSLPGADHPGAWGGRVDEVLAQVKPFLESARR